MSLSKKCSDKLFDNFATYLESKEFKMDQADRLDRVDYYQNVLPEKVEVLDRIWKQGTWKIAVTP